MATSRVDGRGGRRIGQHADRLERAIAVGVEQADAGEDLAAFVAGRRIGDAGDSAQHQRSPADVR